MAAMMVEREPEVARFIDSFKYDQEIAERRSKYGGGTSLPLDSDGYEAKQRKLKEELRNDFLVQQEKDVERPVNMNPYAPKHAPLAPGPQHAADYEREIQKMTDRYHSKYNDVLYDADDEVREQKNIEQQRIEARRNRPPPPASQPAGGQVDYIQQNQRARSEDKRAYQDYMGKYHQPNVVTVKPPVNYEDDRKRLSEERKQEYEDYMEKKAQEERYWKMRGRPVTPPGGLDIGQYDKHLKEVLPKKKKEYKDMLDQQQKDQLYMRARQEPEMPVLDRAGPQQATYLASKPPPGPQQNYTHATYQPRDEQEQERRRQEEARLQRGAPAEMHKNHHYSSDEYEKFQKRLHRQEGEEYREFLKKEEDQNGHAMDYHQFEENQKSGMRYNQQDQGYSKVHENPYEHQSYQHQHTPQRPQISSHQQGSSNMHAVMNHSVYSPSAPVPMHREESPQKMPPQRNGESYIPAPPDYTLDPYRTNPNRFHEQMTAPYPKAASVPAADSGSIPATPHMLSLPVGSYDEARPFIEKERNRQYNDFIAKLPPIKSNRVGMTPHATALTLPVGAYDAARPTFEQQRNQEYNHLKQEGKLDPKKRSLRQKAPTPPEQQGIFESQTRYESYIKNMEKQRNKEYNDFLNKKYLKGKMTSRSEPDRQNASFFPGNEDEQDMKKRYLAQERSRQYNQMLREQEPPRSRSVNIPSDVESGLPIGQQHHESWKRFLREQRNKEYNQMIDTKNQEVRNRDWSYGNSGVLDLRGDDQNQSKKQVLREERQKEYKEYMSQQRMKDAPRRLDYYDNKNEPYQGIFSGLGDHGNTKEMLGQQRKQEYQEHLNNYPHPKAQGRPTWVKETIPNNTDRGRSPVKNPPPVDHYQQMLDEKRREEAQRRRFDDPEIQGRLAPSSRDGRYLGDRQQNYGGYYPQE